MKLLRCHHQSSRTKSSNYYTVFAVASNNHTPQRLPLTDTYLMFTESTGHGFPMSHAMISPLNAVASLRWSGAKPPKRHAARRLAHDARTRQRRRRDRREGRSAALLFRETARCRSERRDVDAPTRGPCFLARRHPTTVVSCRDRPVSRCRRRPRRSRAPAGEGGAAGADARTWRRGRARCSPHPSPCALSAQDDGHRSGGTAHRRWGLGRRSTRRGYCRSPM